MFYTLRKIALFTAVAALLLLTACASGTSPVKAYGDFSSIPDSYPLDKAVADGLYVVDGDAQYSTDKPWTEFFSAVKQGKSASVSVMHKIDGVNYFTDLVYNGDEYLIYKSEDENDGCESYPYLLALEGKDGNPERDVTLYVLSDTDTLTFDYVRDEFYSSTLTPTDEATPRWEWLGFTTYLK